MDCCWGISIRTIAASVGRWMWTEVTGTLVKCGEGGGRRWKNSRIEGGIDLYSIICSTLRRTGVKGHLFSPTLSVFCTQPSAYISRGR